MANQMEGRKDLRLPGPFPPFQLQQPGDFQIREPLPDGLGGHAAHDGIGRDVFCDHRPGADDGPVPDGDAGQDHGLVANPDIVSNLPQSCLRLFDHVDGRIESLARRSPSLVIPKMDDRVVYADSVVGLVLGKD